MSKQVKFNSSQILLEFNLNNNLNISPIDNNSALQTTKLIHALYKSTEKKTWIKVDNNSISNRLGIG